MEKEPYIVSILVPVYGVEKYIERCARSIFSQDYQSLEIIFVDDCTPDKSITIVQRLLLEYPNRSGQTRFIRHTYNRGLSAARNSAIDSATGDFVLFIDPDDNIHSSAVSKLVHKQLESKADVVSGRGVRVTISKLEEFPLIIYKKKENLIQSYIAESMSHHIWGRLIKRSLLSENSIHAKEGVNCGEDAQLVTQIFWFSKKYDWLFENIYYYHVDNEMSYMNPKQDSKFNLVKRVRDNIETAIFIRQFFSGKSENLQRAALELTRKDIAFLLIVSFFAGFRDKRCWSYFKRYYPIGLKVFSKPTHNFLRGLYLLGGACYFAVVIFANKLRSLLSRSFEI